MQIQGTPIKDLSLASYSNLTNSRVFFSTAIQKSTACNSIFQTNCSKLFVHSSTDPRIHSIHHILSPSKPIVFPPHYFHSLLFFPKFMFSTFPPSKSLANLSVDLFTPLLFKAALLNSQYLIVFLPLLSIMPMPMPMSKSVLFPFCLP